MISNLDSLAPSKKKNRKKKGKAQEEAAAPVPVAPKPKAEQKEGKKEQPSHKKADPAPPPDVKSEAEKKGNKKNKQGGSQADTENAPSNLAPQPEKKAEPKPAAKQAKPVPKQAPTSRPVAKPAPKEHPKVQPPKPEGDASDIKFPDLDPNKAITKLTATVGDGAIRLDWVEPGDYRVTVQHDGGAPRAPIEVTGKHLIVQDDLHLGKNYLFTVEKVGDAHKKETVRAVAPVPKIIGLPETSGWNNALTVKVKVEHPRISACHPTGFTVGIRRTGGVNKPADAPTKVNTISPFVQVEQAQAQGQGIRIVDAPQGSNITTTTNKETWKFHNFATSATRSSAIGSLNTYTLKINNLVDDATFEVGLQMCAGRWGNGPIQKLLVPIYGKPPIPEVTAIVEGNNVRISWTPLPPNYPPCSHDVIQHYWNNALRMYEHDREYVNARGNTLVIATPRGKAYKYEVIRISGGGIVHSESDPLILGERSGVRQVNVPPGYNQKISVHVPKHRHWILGRRKVDDLQRQTNTCIVIPDLNTEDENIRIHAASLGNTQIAKDRIIAMTEQRVTDFEAKEITFRLRKDKAEYVFSEKKNSSKLNTIKAQIKGDVQWARDPEDSTGEWVKITVNGPDPDSCQLLRSHFMNLLHFEASAPQAPPTTNKLLWAVEPAKEVSVRRMWAERCDRSSYELKGIWQVKNPYLAAKFEKRKEELEIMLGQRPNIIEGFHGTREENVLSICQNSFDSKRRVAEVYGPGNYFAKDPNVSMGYCSGSSYLIICKLMFGKSHDSLQKLNGDHIWVNDMKYYIIAHPFQVLPLYVVKWKDKDTDNNYGYNRGNHPDMTDNAKRAVDVEANLNVHKTTAGELRKKEFGAIVPGAYNRKCNMTLPETSQIWLGYLHPGKDDKALEKDVAKFLHDCQIDKVRIVHESFRRAAYVYLNKPISRALVQELNTKRQYLSKYLICCEDVQPDSPYFHQQICPRLKGRGRFCRAENIKFVKHGCWFQHPEIWKPTSFAEYTLTNIPLTSAKGDEIVSEFMSTSSTFHNGHPTIVGIKKIVNPVLHHLYEQRKQYSESKHATGAAEVELYHGTNNNILKHLYTHGLRPPSDVQASDDCPVSGKKGLATTLCDNTCTYCTEKHKWSRCHMYGLGIYLADRADKSNRYVSQPSKDGTYRMIKVRCALGNSFLIEGHLKDGQGMHDWCVCEDPSEKIDFIRPVEWDVQDHDSFYVKGLDSETRPGYSVVNSEYIVFTPFQCLPVYEISYKLR